jgi:hypothetical protein
VLHTQFDVAELKKVRFTSAESRLLFFENLLFFVTIFLPFVLHVFFLIIDGTLSTLTLSQTVLPFGQLPYLEHGELKLAQSNAINRYLARIWKIDGENDKEFGTANMLMEEAVDIYNHFGSASKAGDVKDPKRFDHILEKELPRHFGNLEKLLVSG